MDILNNKITSTNDETKFSTQNVGLYGFDSATDGGKWRRVAVNTNGELEMTAEIASAGLATEAKQDTMITDLTQIATNTTRETPQLNRTEAIPVQIMVGSGGANYDALRANGQDLMVMIDDMNPDVAVNSGLSTATLQTAGNTILTDGTQLARCMGSEDPNDPAGTQKQLHLDGSGNVQTNIVNTVNVAPANNTNSGITNDPPNSLAVGLRGRTTITDATTETFLLCDASGKLEVNTSGGGGGGGSTQYDMGDALGATPTGTVALGRDSTGTAQALQVSASGTQFVEVSDFVKGQTNMANSLPVNIASDQSRLDVDTVKDEVVISQANQAITNGNAFTSTAVDMRGYERISFFGTSTNNADFIYILASADDITYYTTGEYITQDFTTGDFSYNATLGVRYLKLTQGSGDFNSNFTITCISSKK